MWLPARTSQNAKFRPAGKGSSGPNFAFCEVGGRRACEVGGRRACDAASIDPPRRVWDNLWVRKRIGEFLVEKGLITQAQVEEILAHSRKTGMRFGEAGMDLGIVTRERLVRLFGPSYKTDFFNLEPRYFPEVTRDVLSSDTLIRNGALLLGYKTEYRFFRATKRLNVGLLSPEDKDAAAAVEKAAREKLGAKGFDGLKIFLVLADQYLEVLRQVYQVPDAEIREREPSQVDATLQLFVQTAKDAANPGR